MNRPTPISVFSDQRRTKSTTWSRTSCGTHVPVRVPQVFFLARHAPPSTQPGPRPWSAPSSPRTQSVSASPPPGGGDAPELEKQPPRSRRTPSANGKTPLAAGPVPHTGPTPEPCPKGAASEWPPSPLRCNAFVPFSYVRSAILTDERFLHFQLRQDSPHTSLPDTPCGASPDQTASGVRYSERVKSLRPAGSRARWDRVALWHNFRPSASPLSGAALDHRLFVGQPA